MNTAYVARKVTLNDSFKERAELKLRKLDKFFDDAKAQVTVSTQKDEASVELTVWANGMIFRAEAQNTDKLDALDEAVENLTRRIRKNKTKLLKKVKASGFDFPEETVAEEMDYDVIRTKEVPLRPMTVDEAMPVMEKYLDDAYLAHLPSVRIVHGKGTGALRNAVQAHLKRLKYVKSFHLGEFGEGDAGVTIAEFKD